MELEQQQRVRAGGRMTRSPPEIARVLEALVARRVPIKSHLRNGERLFESLIAHADAAGGFIVVEPSPDEDANDELVASPRCAFFTDPSGWHVEFAAAALGWGLHGGKSVIRFRFPEVLSNVQTREHSRAMGSPTVRIRCVADEGGVMPFEGWIVDVSPGGIGFLTYEAAITLEPGTILKECRLEADWIPELVVDLEVRYSELVSLPDGTRAKRSGCRFVDSPEAIQELVSRFR